MSVPRGFLSEWSPTKREIESLTQMNIYVTSTSAQTCARNLDNWTLTCQIPVVACFLSKYARDCTFPINDLSRFVSSNSPWFRWMLNDTKNMDWMMDYGVCLVVEYGQRMKVRHYGSQHIFDFVDEFGAPVGAEPIAFLNRAFDDTFDFRWRGTDVCQAYKDYLNAKWTTSKKKLSWGGRMPPAWWIEMQLVREGKETIIAPDAIGKSA